MRLCGLVAAASLAAILSSAGATENVPQTDAATASVFELTPETLENFTKEHENVLVEFYAPWCGKCKTVKKEYERSAEVVAAHNLPVKIARVDANKHAEFAEEYGVENLPTFYLFRNHSSYREEFPTLTTGEAYAAGLAKMLGSDLDLSPAKVFNEGAMDFLSWIFWRGTDDGRILTTLVLYNPNTLTEDAAAAAKELESVFTETAKIMMRFANLRFAVVNDGSIIAELEYPTDKATLVLYKDHDEGKSVYTGPVNTAELQNWVYRQDTPLVVDIWHRTLQSFRRRVSTLGLFFLTEQQFEHIPTLHRVIQGLQRVAYRLEEAGHFQRGEFTIGVANGQKYVSWMNHFQLNPERIPAMSIENTTAQLNFAVADFADEASQHMPTKRDLADLAKSSGEPEEAYRPAPFVSQEQAVDATGETGSATPKQDKSVVWVEVPEETLFRAFEAYFRGELTPIVQQQSAEE